MNIVLISPPAAGKGTLAEMLVKKNNYITISAGQLLRDVDPNTEVGKEIRATQAKGLLVDNNITGCLMKKKINSLNINDNVIYDGFLREINQVDILNKILLELNKEIDYAVYLNIPYEVALDRTLGRQICPNCKRTYNKNNNMFKPTNENMCDVCNVNLEKRNDDNEESLKQRFKLFNEKTIPVIEYFRKKNKLIELDASKDVNIIYDDLMKRIGD